MLTSNSFEEKIKLIASSDFAEDARKLLEAPLSSSNNLCPALVDTIHSPTSVPVQGLGYQSLNNIHEQRSKERSKSKSREIIRSMSPLQPRTELLDVEKTKWIPVLCSDPGQVLTQVTAIQPAIFTNNLSSMMLHEGKNIEQNKNKNMPEKENF